MSKTIRAGGFDDAGYGGIYGYGEYGIAGERARNDVSEFGWGSGLTPPGLEDAPPAEGGRYHGKAPDCEPHIRVNLDRSM